MSTTTTTENLFVEVRRTFPVSRERLFDAWTDPEEARQWFGGEGCNIRELKMDVRPGGKYTLVVDSCEHGVMEVAGEYREVARPSKLVYTWRWMDDADWEGVESVVTVEFIEVTGGAEVRLTHRGFPTEESRGNHEGGWTRSLEKLTGRVTR